MRLLPMLVLLVPAACVPAISQINKVAHFSYMVEKNCFTEIFILKKAISVTGCGGLQGCDMLRIPHCLENLLTDGGKFVSHMHRPRYNP
jgi:hypothetical protein